MKTRIPCLLAGLALLAIGSVAHSATITWTNTSGGNWSNTNNWSSHQLPTNGDTVLITTPGTYTVAVDIPLGVNVYINVTNLTLGAGGASGVQTLDVMNPLIGFTASSLLVTGGGVVNVGADNMELSGGTMTVANGGVFNLNASHQSFGFLMDLVVTNGGVVNAAGRPLNGCCTYAPTFSGPVTVANGGLLTANQVQAGTSFMVAQGGVLNINNPGYLYTSGFGILSNAGTINLNIGGIYAGLMNLANGVINFQGNTYSFGNYFTNQGLVTVSAGPGTIATINVTGFEPATGTVSNLTGTLVLGTFQGTLKGNYNAAAGAIIQFFGTNGVTPLLPGSPLVLAGGGQYQFTSGYLRLPTDAIPNLALVGTTLELGPGFQGGAITNLTLDGMALSNTLPVTGTLTVTNSTVYGNLTIAGGAVMRGSNAVMAGAVTVANGGLFAVNGAVTGGPFTVAAGGRLDVAGPLNIYAPLTNAGAINLTNSPITLYNNGTSSYRGGVVNQAGGFINFWGNGATVSGNYGPEYFVNLGRVNQSAGTGTNVINVLGFDNSQGTVTNLSGTLGLGLQGSLTGTYHTAAGTTIYFTGPNSAMPLTPGTPLVLAGPGQYEFTFGYLSLPTNAVPELLLLGGTLKLGASFQGGAITNLMLGGIALTNTLPVTGAFTATNSPLYGNFTVAGGGMFSANNGILHGAVTVANGGLLSVFKPNGGMAIGADGSLTVAAGGKLDLAGSLNLFGPLTNAGTINLSNSPIFMLNNGTTIYQGGLVNLASGLMDFVGDGVMGGIFGGFGNEYFINQGRMTRSAGFGNTGTSVAHFTNSGIITVQSGFMQLGKVTLQSTGSLNVGLNNATNYGSIAVASNTVLNGAFNAALNNGYVPTNGSSFNVLYYGSFSGSFNSLGLPGVVSWQSTYGSTNLTLLVSGGGKPQFGTLNLSGTNLIFNGAGGSPGSNYIVLSSTNLALPLINWTAVATNTFDGSGHFSFTNNVNLNKPLQAFILKLP